jgi:transcriptional regulator with XRE-family HTH domain
MAKSFRELKENMSLERRENVEERARNILMHMMLQELRQSRQLTQQELADILQVNQAALSKMENQNDIRVSTLHKLIGAMGGSLKIVAEFPDGDVIIDQFEPV